MTTAAADLDDVGTTLLQAAKDILAAEGAPALTVRHIAATAGMSTMNVYSRFGGKDGVVEQLFVEGFGLLGEAMRRVKQTSDPMADLRRCGQAYRNFAIHHATLYAIMFDRVVPDYTPSDGALEVADGTLQLLADRLQRAIDARLLRRADPRHLAAMVWSTCHGVVSLELKSIGPAPIRWERVFADATEALLRGMAA